MASLFNNKKLKRVIKNEKMRAVGSCMYLSELGRDEDDGERKSKADEGDAWQRN